MEQLVLDLNPRPEPEPPIRPEGELQRQLVALMADAILAAARPETKDQEDEDE